MVIWGHEHECLIDPTWNPEMNFHVMQPGSSVATSLAVGEAVPKQVAILSIKGKDFTVETIRLKTVRPFIMKEIVLAEEKEAMRLVKKVNNRTELTRLLEGIIQGMIEQANEEWEEAQDEEDRDEDEKPPLPLIRLRVEYTAPGGGNFDCENPQRFSNRFLGKVANVNDVVQFYRKKAGVSRKSQNAPDMPEEAMLASLTLDTVRVEKLVREFLTAQSLTIFPQNSFGNAVSEFVDKDDKHAMEEFVEKNLENQVQQLMNMDHMDEDTMRDAMEEGKSHLEELYAAGALKNKRTRRKPQPDGYDSDLNGPWEDQPAAIIRSDNEDEQDSDDEPPAKPAARGRGKEVAVPKKAPPAKKAAPRKNGRSKKKVVEEESDSDEDIVMVDSDEAESQSQLFVPPAPTTRGSRKVAPAKAAPTRGATSKQSQLNFSQSSTQPRSNGRKVQEVIDEISDDDDDAFEPPPSTRAGRGRR